MDVTKQSLKKQLGKSFDDRWLSLYRYAIPNVDLTNYIPDDYFYCHVDPVFSKPRTAKIIDDKNLYDLLFYDAKRPKTVVRLNKGIILDRKYNMIDIDKALAICKNSNNLIFKPVSYSSGGRGILFWDANKDTEQELKDLLCLKNVTYVVQEIVSQHEVLSRIHKESLNTIRLMTLLWKNEVIVLSSVLRMGSGGSRVDNVSSGGMACGILPDGRLKDDAYDGMFNRHEEHPQAGRFGQYIIPNFDKCIELVKNLAPRVEEFSKMIGWDIAIDESGEPLLIEANLTFQELDFHQLCNGPIFGSMTTEIMTYVKSNNRKKLE